MFVVLVQRFEGPGGQSWIIKGCMQWCFTYPYLQPRSANLWTRVITSRGEQASVKGRGMKAKLSLNPCDMQKSIIDNDNNNNELLLNLAKNTDQALPSIPEYC
jgi:hypothetical protein